MVSRGCADSVTSGRRSRSRLSGNPGLGRVPTAWYGYGVKYFFVSSVSGLSFILGRDCFSASTRRSQEGDR